MRGGSPALLRMSRGTRFVFIYMHYSTVRGKGKEADPPAEPKVSGMTPLPPCVPKTGISEL